MKNKCQDNGVSYSMVLYSFSSIELHVLKRWWSTQCVKLSDHLIDTLLPLRKAQKIMFQCEIFDRDFTNGGPNVENDNQKTITAKVVKAFFQGIFSTDVNWDIDWLPFLSR